MRNRLLTAENRKWWTLAAVGFGLFMIMLDNTVVTPARLRDRLGRSSAPPRSPVRSHRAPGS